MCLKCAVLLVDRLDLLKKRVKMNSDIASVLRLHRFGSSASEQSALCRTKQLSIVLLEVAFAKRTKFFEAKHVGTFNASAARQPRQF